MKSWVSIEMTESRDQIIERVVRCYFDMKDPDDCQMATPRVESDVSAGLSPVAETVVTEVPEVPE